MFFRHILASLCFPLLICAVFAHSHLARPLPTRQLDCRVGNGRAKACYGPCAPLGRYGNPTGVSRNKPAETWRRGEFREIRWHRNNHFDRSGFVRLTLVPIAKMMNKRMHDRFTFHITCWHSGLHKCSSRRKNVCGNDRQGKAYRTSVRVPTSYPDGLYAFGWSW